MAGRTGYTPITNASAMLGPAQITAVYEHFDPLVDGSRLDATGLPSTGNWQGRTLFLEDTKTVVVWNGAAWIRFDTQWISYTPTTTNVSGGTIAASYARQGDIVQVSILHTLAGANFTGQPSYSLPVNHVSSAIEWLAGSVLLRDASVPTELSGVVRKSSTTSVSPYSLRASGTYVQFENVNATTPFTWAVDDTLVMNFSYRAA